MIKIVSTGIAGCGEKEYFEKFSRLCEDNGKKVNIISATEEVLVASRKSGFEINKYNLLNFPKTTRAAWYQSAFDNILEEKLEKNKINLVNLHISYWWKNGPEEVVRGDILNNFLNKLDPMFYTQIIDSAIKVEKRLNMIADHVGRCISQEDMLRWQDVEYHIAQTFAEINRKRLYMIAEEQPADTLYRLIFKKELKTYISYPMTHFEEDNEKKKVEKFIKELNKILIVFNPGTIEDYGMYRPGRVKTLSGEMTIKRDFRLIDQSDIVIVFFPKIVHSSGAMLEMEYANSTGKPVYLVWPHKNYSPFTVFPVRKVFFSAKGCIEEMKKLAKLKK